jgi:hypothetical protein
MVIFLVFLAIVTIAVHLLEFWRDNSENMDDYVD